MTTRTILVIDDDPSQALLTQRMLVSQGYTVSVAASGEAGLEHIHTNRPDAVFCDVLMPGMDGFEVLRRVRADISTVAMGFVLVTSADSRDNVRRGMQLGADDFLAKPVKRQDLIETAQSVLAKRASVAHMFSSVAMDSTSELQQRYASSRTERVPLLQSSENLTGRLMVQTVLFTDIRGFTAMSERLPAAAVAEFLTAYLREACKPVLQHGGRVMKIMGDGMMVVFGLNQPDDVAAHAAAGLRAALSILNVAREFRGWLAGRFPVEGLPEFNIGIGVHTGEVMVFRMAVGGEGGQTGGSDLTAVGDTVNIAARLESKSKELGWPLVASAQTIDAAGAGFAVAARLDVTVAGRSGPIVVGHVVADYAAHDVTVPKPGPVNALPSGVDALLAENARAAADAAKAALDATLRFAAGGGAITPLGGGQPALPADVTVRGYKILSKIGEGGMSLVYLADDLARDHKAVLKVLKVGRKEDEHIWQRFFQESAILAAIDHEHVVRVFDQGFGDELAYIAMEYLGGGSLREVMDRGVSARQALSLLSQAASGLAEIHRRGIIHRDIKPANLMLRTEGVLVLTDFGVAKRLEQTMSHTVHGEVLGTPHYISPEQAQGGDVGPGADIYSLGVIFYEMLTGTRPYTGETLIEILSQHIMAPIPRLPERMADFQPLIDGMLAKRVADRFADADAVLTEIDRVWTMRSSAMMPVRPAAPSQ